MTVHHQLGVILHGALQTAQTAGALPAFDPPEITIERPRDVAFGDFASPSPQRPLSLADARNFQAQNSGIM